jgi:alpha-mannosidase
MHTRASTGLTLAYAITLLAAAGLAPAEAETLWQIGKADNSTAEFAFAPGDYKAYRSPGFFVVGVSDAKADWPYVQPGTIDGGWAPGTPQTFEVLFGLKAAPSGDGRLVLDFADTHAGDPPLLRVEVNDQSWEFKTPKGAGDASVYGDPAKGREHVIDLPVPAAALRAGDNRVAITTVKGSWVLWDALRFDAPEGAGLAPVASRTVIRSAKAATSVLVWHEGHEAQAVTLAVAHVGAPVEADVVVGDAKSTAKLVQGSQTIEVPIPPVTAPATLAVSLAAQGKTLAESTVEVTPVRRWELNIVHQTHLDIGYTHTQEEVLRLQVEWLRRAMQYIEKSKDYPEEARFKWHPEGMWAVDEFMRTASEEEKKQFVEDCRKGQIHLDALYAQAMTGMYKEEELLELMGAAKRFEKQYGASVTSAMQSDVPGYTWGLASALAHCGVPYMSLGPNGGHRVGHTFTWGDRPFWWVDPSGQHKVLFWMCGGGYYGLRDANENEIFAVLRRLEEKQYPYELAMARMLSGGDNAPPNPNVSDAVLAWNKKYASPKLVLSRNSEFLKKFAEKYGDKLPVQSGDFTPYWEDGSASTAKATGANRRASERIAQAQILWAMLHPEMALHERFDVAWNKMVMYDEHTWGAHNSISRPDDPFAVQQDRYKQAYAFDGATLTDELLRDITAPASGSAIDVYNTAAWARGGLIRLPKEQSAAGDLVKDEQGKPVPSQRLTSGELAFMAADVPAFGARRFTVQAGPAAGAGSAKAEGLRIANGILALAIDPKSGAIKSLQRKGVEGEWVDAAKAEGLNSYLYIIGRNADEGRATVQGPATVTVEDAGPLVATLRIESDAPGCARLVRQVSLIDGADSVELINTTDKLKERRPEGLYFGFPFNLPGAIARVDVPWAVVEVEKDQLPGANRNFYCVQRWVDLSSADRGVTWVTVDAPMLQFDPIKIAQPYGMQYWRTHIEPTPFLWSWTMNNHWETNYKADQEGLITFRYALRPHAGGYDAVAAQRFGRDVCQPLIAVGADGGKPVAKSLLRVEGRGARGDEGGVVVTQVRPSRDGKATMVRLFNVADEPRKVRLAWSRPIGATWISNPMEDEAKPAPAEIEMVKFEIVTLRVEK